MGRRRGAGERMDLTPDVDVLDGPRERLDARGGHERRPGASERRGDVVAGFEHRVGAELGREASSGLERCTTATRAPAAWSAHIPMIPRVPAPTTTATSSPATSSIATACRQHASGSIEGARSNGNRDKPARRSTRRARRRAGCRCPRDRGNGSPGPSARCAPTATHVFGCTPTSVPSSRTPATSWTGILGVGVPWSPTVGRWRRSRPPDADGHLVGRRLRLPHVERRPAADLRSARPSSRSLPWIARRAASPDARLASTPGRCRATRDDAARLREQEDDGMNGLSGRVALVTGASGGIGAAVARSLAGRVSGSGWPAERRDLGSTARSSVRRPRPCRGRGVRRTDRRPLREARHRDRQRGGLRPVPRARSGPPGGDDRHQREGDHLHDPRGAAAPAGERRGRHRHDRIGGGPSRPAVRGGLLRVEVRAGRVHAPWTTSSDRRASGARTCAPEAWRPSSRWAGVERPRCPSSPG